MKKIIALALLTGCMLLVSLSMNAQNMNAEDKPALNKPKATSQASAPAQPVLKNDNSTPQNNRPPAPGGEHKPADTRIKSPNEPQAAKPIVPAIKPATTATENKGSNRAVIAEPQKQH
jgi:hypothetical protein